MRRRLVDEIGLHPTGPEEMVAAMAAFLVPPRWVSGEPSEAAHGLIERLLDEGITVGSSPRRGSPDVFMRVSAHLHTDVADIGPLIEVLERW